MVTGTKARRKTMMAFTKSQSPYGTSCVVVASVVVAGLVEAVTVQFVVEASAFMQVQAVIMYLMPHEAEGPKCEPDNNADRNERKYIRPQAH